MWISGGLGNDELALGLSHLKGIFQPDRCHDSYVKSEALTLQRSGCRVPRGGCRIPWVSDRLGSLSPAFVIPPQLPVPGGGSKPQGGSLRRAGAAPLPPRQLGLSDG